MTVDHGQLFRDAWISGVQRHYPGDPKPGYVAPWEDTPDWERKAAAAVCGQVLAFIDVSEGAVTKLSREQRGQFVALCWTAQIYCAFADPKPSYVASWKELPAWQQEVDADIFDAIELHVAEASSD